MLRLLAAAAIALMTFGAGAKTPLGAAAICLNDAGALRVAEARVLPFGEFRSARVSDDVRAQRLFEQGLVFGWGFNFAEAVRSFRAATLADLDCAMCRWGIAWALGPSINHDMKAADVPVAIDALVQAGVYTQDGDARARALIDALSRRYSDQPQRDAERLALEYASAMQQVADRYADDADIAVLAAEALMNAHPYDYWTPRGQPRAWTAQIETLLDRALRVDPAHPGAHHYRIHLYEGSRTPERALNSAQRIGSLAPLAGHLVHMPSHVYLRVGRYHDAVLANAAAVKSDRDYLATVEVNPSYAADYVPHNVHFLWASALWSGESAVAREAAGALSLAAAQLPLEPSRAGVRQHYAAAPWLTSLRFGEWSRILAQPVPSIDEMPYLAGVAHYARGMAYAATGERPAAEREAALLARASDAARARKLMVKNINSAADLLDIGRALLAAELALMVGDAAVAVRQARAAAAAEDKLEIDEPPAWQIPARHVLGRALLAANRAIDARAVYREDLVRHPENAVALAGLAEAQRRLRQATEADALLARARVAWRYADRPLP
jgi:hypothetical protein